MAFDRVRQRLEKRMTKRLAEVYQYCKNNGLTMRGAAMNIAVQRAIDAVHVNPVKKDFKSANSKLEKFQKYGIIPG